MDTLEALQGLRQIEADLEELYAWFAELFAEDLEAGELFARLSREERSHKVLVDHQINLARNHSGTEVDVVVDPAALKSLLGDIERLRQQDPPPSLSEAVSSAVMMEFVADEAYLGRVVSTSSKSIEAMIDRLVDAGQEHHGRLKDFAKERGMLVLINAAS
jgi:rubrerythrin